MPIKVYKSSRGARKKASIVDRTKIHRGKPFAKLTKSRRRLSGRGKAGRITTRHRGGGAKRRDRIVDFSQGKMNVPGKVERVEFDPNRSAFLALVIYADGERRYHLAWDGAKPKQEVMSGDKAPEKKGNRMPLKNVTPGATVFNVELKPGRGGKLARSAGASVILMDTREGQAQLKMTSGEVRLVSEDCYATVGEASNSDHRLQRIGSAGRNRRLGRRPQVRGKAMNPVDHPHGGGEGNQPVGMKYPKTKWGKHALGVKTRKAGKYSDKMILQRRNIKKGK